MEIGGKLKKRRIEIGLTMREVAEKANVSEATVSRWESGDIANMRRNKIVLLAKALQVSPAYIMGWEDKSIYNKPIKEYNFNKKETEHIKMYRELNSLGQDKADEYIVDLLENSKYTQKEQNIQTYSHDYEIAAFGHKGTKGTYKKPDAEILD